MTTKDIKLALIVVGGVMLAGFTMNALRDISFVRSMIDGFDS